jgi:hypothetical protein
MVIEIAYLPSYTMVIFHRFVVCLPEGNDVFLWQSIMAGENEPCRVDVPIIQPPSNWEVSIAMSTGG